MTPVGSAGGNLVPLLIFDLFPHARYSPVLMSLPVPSCHRVLCGLCVWGPWLGLRWRWWPIWRVLESLGWPATRPQLGGSPLPLLPVPARMASVHLGAPLCAAEGQPGEL